MLFRLTLIWEITRRAWHSFRMPVYFGHRGPRTFWRLWREKSHMWHRDPDGTIWFEPF